MGITAPQQCLNFLPLPQEQGAFRAGNLDAGIGIIDCLSHSFAGARRMRHGLRQQSLPLPRLLPIIGSLPCTA